MLNIFYHVPQQSQAEIPRFMPPTTHPHGIFFSLFHQKKLFSVFSLWSDHVIVRCCGWLRHKITDRNLAIFEFEHTFGVRSEEVLVQSTDFTQVLRKN